MKQTIVILHGWGVSGSKYHTIQSLLEKKGYAVFAPDFPGFGKEKLTKQVMTLNDYVAFVHRFFRQKNIEKAILIGHSFGGRVAAKFSVAYPEKVTKLILTGAPLIKKPLSLKKQLISQLTKPVKFITNGLPQNVQQFLRKILYRSLGEWDYYKAGSLRETFKNIIHEDLQPLISAITVPTLVLWGEEDTFVPLSLGKEISQKIPDALFESIPHASHKLPYETPEVFTKKVMHFLKK